MTSRLHWVDAKDGGLGVRVDWPALLKSGRQVDPYLAWDDLKYLARTGQERGTDQSFPVVLEHSRTPGHTPRFETLWLDKNQLIAQLNQLLVKGGAVERLQLAAIRSPVQNVRVGTVNYPPPARELRTLRILGVIDDWCPFAHPALAPQPNSAELGGVEFLWHQSGKSASGNAVPSPPWHAPAGKFTYGAQLDGLAIRAAIKQAAAKFGASRTVEEAVYRELGYADLHHGSKHGVGILHAAAGELRSERGKESALDGVPIVFVQFPTAAVEDTSGGWMGLYAVDAIDYIIERAEFLRGVALARDVEVTIVLSYGATAGPHDGTSVVEAAIEERLSQGNGNVRVVLAAGNNYGKRIHASRKLSGSGGSVEFLVLVPPDKATETFVEFWLPWLAAPGDVEVTVTDPSGAASTQLAVGDSRALREPGKPYAAGVILSQGVAQGDDKTMILLAVAPTRSLPGGTGPAGIWKVRIKPTTVHLPASACVHAWVERDDVITGLRRTQQARFVDDGTGYVPDVSDPRDTGAVDLYTLNSIANSPGTVVVGGYRICDRTVAGYSSAGPTSADLRSKLDFSAPSDVGIATRGILTGGSFSGSTRRMSGTSIAGPIVARRMIQNAIPKMLPDDIRGDQRRRGPRVENVP